MNSNDILRKLSFDSAQGTSQMSDMGKEMRERFRDMNLITEPGESLLIGTSPSEMKAWLVKFRRQPTGISTDDFGEKWQGLIFKEDMHDLSFPDESFDFVYGSQVLEHSPAPMIVLTQISRVLRKGGKGFFWMPEDIENQKLPYHYSCFPKEIWEDLFKKVGLEVYVMTKRGTSWGYAVKKADIN